MDKISLSNKSVKKKINTMTSNTEEILVTQLKNFIYFNYLCLNFSLQVDDSTDITNNAQLLVFNRYNVHNIINEEYLFFKSLESNANVKIFS